MDYTLSKRVTGKFVEAVKVAADSRQIAVQDVAAQLTRAGGEVQRFLYRLIHAIIDHWKIDARYEQYDEQYVHIYKWAEGVETNEQGD